MNAVEKNAEVEARGATAFLLACLVNLAALAIAANVVPGVKVSSFWILLLAAVALAAASYLIEPLLFFLTMPINIASFGAFSVVVSGIVVMITARFVPGFHVRGVLWGLLPAVATALIISLCRVVLRSILVQLYSRRQ